MRKLNFNPYPFRFKKDEERLLIFCALRKKFLVLTPEEWVRQHVIAYLMADKNYPASLINAEKLLKINGLSKRYDVVVYHPSGKILLLVECKSPEIAIAQNTFDQIARYNLTLKADFLMVTNGLTHYFCKMDYDNSRYSFLRDIPSYPLSPTQNLPI